jgi:hypothetical protein
MFKSVSATSLVSLASHCKGKSIAFLSFFGMLLCWTNIFMTLELTGQEVKSHKLKLGNQLQVP